MEKELYTQKYEYVREMVQVFIDSEEQLHSRELSGLYSSDSWTANFFEINLSQLDNPEVQKAIVQKITQNATQQAQYNTALARVQTLFTNIVMAAGEEFISELEENCVMSLVHLKSDNHSKRSNQYKFFKRQILEHPILVVSAIGSSYFQAKHIAFARTTGRGSQK